MLGVAVLNPIGDVALHFAHLRGLAAVVFHCAGHLVEPRLDRRALVLERRGVGLLAGQEVAAVGRFELRDFILGLAQLPQHIERVGAQGLKFVVANGDKEQNRREHRDGQDTDKGGAEELAVEFVLGLEKIAEAFVGGKFVGKGAHKRRSFASEKAYPMPPGAAFMPRKEIRTA